MKISKVIEELTKLKEYLGDRDLEACTVNDAMTGVNVLYLNDEGGWTSTTLDGEKLERQLRSQL